MAASTSRPRPSYLPGVRAPPNDDAYPAAASHLTDHERRGAPMSVTAVYPQSIEPQRRASRRLARHTDRRWRTRAAIEERDLSVSTPRIRRLARSRCCGAGIGVWPEDVLEQRRRRARGNCDRSTTALPQSRASLISSELVDKHNNGRKDADCWTRGGLAVGCLGSAWGFAAGVFSLSVSLM
jgi:hypothetical protein